MIPAPLPSDEAERLAALGSYQVLDTESEQAFNDLVSLAARLTESPVSLITLLDKDRQWFKARHGLDLDQTPRDQAFCSHAILQPDEPFIVEDATKDPRFAGNPLVTGGPAIRAYLGMPIVNPEGHALGSLCVIDRKPRTFDAENIETVRTLARAVSVNLELRRALLRSREAALTDGLTGLPNRRATMAAMSDAVAKRSPVAVIAIDLDYFKEINDGEGHAAGDALLQAVAERLRRVVRPGDVVGRLGGDEFVVLVIGMATRTEADVIAQRISTALSEPVPYAGRSLHMGATLGVAVTPDDAEDAEMAVRVADEALLRAKRDGRGGIGAAQREDASHLLRAAAIVRAFDGGPVSWPGGDAETVDGARVVLQPIVALGRDGGLAGQVVAVEALARWSDPDVGNVPPAELFPLLGPKRAARLGAAVRIKALAAFAKLRREGLAGARLALNLSASEVSRADVVVRVEEQVAAAGLTLSSVEIEITEEVLLERVSNRTLQQLVSLRERGARLVLDDFGTGTSGLAQLLRLPLDGLKLDKQFVQGLGRDRRAQEIVRATMSLAHGLGLQAVAEGVETRTQLEMLRALNCDSVQGFLVSRPLPPAELGAWASARSAVRVLAEQVEEPAAG